MMRSARSLVVTAMAMGIGLGACARDDYLVAERVMQTPPRTGREAVVSLPAGTRLLVQLAQPLGLGMSVVGERFTARVVRGGQLPEGAEVTGYVTDLRSPVPADGQPAGITLAFEELSTGEWSYPVLARVVATDVNAPREIRPEYVLGGPRAGETEPGAIIASVRNLVAGPAVGSAGTLISLGTEEGRFQLPAGTVLALELERGAGPGGASDAPPEVPPYAPSMP